MTTTEVLREAHRCGVELHIEGQDQIRFRAPAGALEDGLLDEIRRNKTEGQQEHLSQTQIVQSVIAKGG